MDAFDVPKEASRLPMWQRLVRRGSHPTPLFDHLYSVGVSWIFPPGSTPLRADLPDPNPMLPARACSPLRLLVVLLVASTACARARPPSGPPNVVLICLDTVRADHLGCYGYGRPTPTLDALAARSLVFREASATAGWTKPSVPSFLTGTYPSQHGVYEGSAHDEAGEVTDLLPSGALTLAEVFRQHGYATGAFVHNAQLRVGNGFEQGFDLYQQENMDAREIRWRALDWIDAWLDDGGKRGADRSFFLYLHFLDAHWPYPAPEEWVTRFAPAEATARFRGKESKALYAAINSGEHALTAEDRAALEALYDGALGYLDFELGRFFAGLSLRGLAENTLVCVVADHGEEFGEHGKVGHGHGLWENLLHVPWILFRPGSAPQRNDTPVSLIDLFPTLVAAAGLPATGGHEGVDRLAEPGAERPILAEHKAPDRYFQALRTGREKLLRRFTPTRPSAAGGDDELALPIEPGTRWEAEFVVNGNELVVTQLKPRDEEPNDPPELKGRLDSLTAAEFRIAGIRIGYDEASKRQTEAGTSGPELANGQVVKVRGQYAAGVLRAERIRFYAPDESDQLELRGTVEALENGAGGGRLRMGGLAFQIPANVELKGVERKSAKRRLAREEIARLLESGAGALGPDAYEIRRELYDLESDGAELGPRAVEPGTALDALLDELGSTLARKRIFAAGDQRALDERALQELQDIGYGGG